MKGARSIMVVGALVCQMSDSAGAQEDRDIDPAVQALLRGMGMMSEEQIAQFFREVDARERLNALLAAGSAKGAPRAIEIDFLRKSESQGVRLSANRVTALEIVDQFGKPWPIRDFLAAPDGALSVRPIGDERSVLAITPLQRHLRGNIVLSLEGVTTPIHLRFETLQSEFDEPLTLKVRETYGGNTETPGLAETYSQGYGDDKATYRRFLQGIIPDEAYPLRSTADFDVLAWSFNDKLVVKTQAELLHPGYQHRDTLGDIKLFVLDPVELLEFTVGGADERLLLEYR